jgi:hypothetical protein
MLRQIVRSPLTVIFILALFMGMLGLGAAAPEVFREYDRIILTVMVVIGVGFFLLVTVHNRRHPSSKISMATWTPYEFKEEDEGLKWITLQACRKVYMFYYYAIPAAALVIFFFGDRRFVPFAVLFLMGAIQYFIFWREERKYNREQEVDEDEEF